MQRSIVPFRSRASSYIWPRVAVLGLVGIAAAGCSDSGRFDSNPFASNRNATPPQETTGSVSSRPASSGRVESQPLPAPSRPATVASSGGTANGGQGLGAYRPSTHEVTGSVQQAPASTGHWTWDGGSAVTVGYGESIETIARKYGVPASAIMQTNGFTETSLIKPGQRVVIPRYVSTSTASGGGR
jgi:LysM repeat protein